MFLQTQMASLSRTTAITAVTAVAAIGVALTAAGYMAIQKAKKKSSGSKTIVRPSINISDVILVGLPFSTFTRTIALGLYEKKIPFEWHRTAGPHSDEAKASHPMGRIPSFNHNGIWFAESIAISRYIDDATFDCSTGDQLRPISPVDAAIMDQWVSHISDYCFAYGEHQVSSVLFYHFQFNNSTIHCLSKIYLMIL
jgi:hypothetical protein